MVIHRIIKISAKTLTAICQWFDADHGAQDATPTSKKPDRVEWLRCLPFLFLHLGCLGVIWVGWSWTALGVCAALYFLRMFAITGFYHRYFSHKTFSTTRTAQFIFALLGATAVQRGALWWAYHHRHHHQHSDEESDAHSPQRHGFWWAHMGWITSAKNFPTEYHRVKDLAKFPELVFLNRFDILVPVALALGLLFGGNLLNKLAPSIEVTGGQLLVWGFFVSTTILFHATCLINSMAHILGSRRYKTDDNSRNSLLLALITLGEGWHNNHHYYMNSTRQGFYWWEIDVTYYGLRALAALGIIWNLRPVPAEVLRLGLDKSGALSVVETKRHLAGKVRVAR